MRLHSKWFFSCLMIFASLHLSKAKEPLFFNEESSSPCDTMDGVQVCDYSGSAEEIKLEIEKNVQTVSIKNSQKLHIGPSNPCVNFKLENVNVITFDDSAECSNKSLDVKSSKMNIVPNYFAIVTLQNSEVEEMVQLDHIRELKIINSNISQLRVTTSLEKDSSVEIHNSTVATLESLVTKSEDSTLFDNVTIFRHEYEMPGIIMGNTILRDCVLPAESIFMQTDSVISIEGFIKFQGTIQITPEQKFFPLVKFDASTKSEGDFPPSYEESAIDVIENKMTTADYLAIFFGIAFLLAFLVIIYLSCRLSRYERFCHKRRRYLRQSGKYEYQGLLQGDDEDDSDLGEIVEIPNGYVRVPKGRNRPAPVRADMSTRPKTSEVRTSNSSRPVTVLVDR